jgi:hypothetical protein
MPIKRQHHPDSIANIGFIIHNEDVAWVDNRLAHVLFPCDASVTLGQL